MRGAVLDREDAPRTMVLGEEARPSVLPTERLLPTGVCRPQIRAELRRIADGRNLLSIAALWALVIGIVAAAVLIDNPFGYVAAFVVMGPIYVRFAILMHEAAHKLLFTDKRRNDWLGTWLIAYPAFAPIKLYRRAHFAHHREEFGREEPDMAFYSGYRCTPRTLARRLFRDAIGISGWKNFAALLRGVRVPAARRVVVSILAAQLVLWGASWAVTGRWWIYPLLWWLPWMTQWRVLNRLRSIAEHGGLEQSKDRRVTTHNVRQSLAARVWLVPYNTGWHLAHHVDMGIPWRNLPKFHAELVEAGYVTDALTYSSYRALWRELASSPVSTELMADVDAELSA
ncbi:MAG: fatty acid desaturase family protein [Acidimicrobiales bacterium]